MWRIDRSLWGRLPTRIGMFRYSVFRIATVGKTLISGITGRSSSASWTLTGQTYAGDSTSSLFQPKASFADSLEIIIHI